MEEQKRPKIGIGVLMIQDGKLLMTKRIGRLGTETRGTTGGHLEFGETFEQCAMRETKEEIGVDITKLKLIAANNILAYGKHYVDITFLAQSRDGEPQILEPENLAECRWFALDQLPENIFAPVIYSIKSYITGQIYVS